VDVTSLTFIIEFPDLYPYYTSLQVVTTVCRQVTTKSSSLQN